MRQTFDSPASPDFGRLHLPKLRAELAKHAVDAFLIPHEDEHQNEYLPPANERLAWVTGFTGSAGAAVVDLARAAVFVDGRYRLQVAAEVDATLFELRDLVDGGVAAWLTENLTPGNRVGYDPRLHSPDALERLKAAVERAGAVLTPVAQNLVDAAWSDRPPPPAAPVVSHPLELAGESSADKRARLGAALAGTKGDAALITAPASLAWLFNIRGGDVVRSPLALGQAILRADGSARLFLDPAKTSPELAEWLGNGVVLETPEALADALTEFAGGVLQIDPALSSAWCFDAARATGARVIGAPDPCVLARAAKNSIELAGARCAHRRDATAVVRFLHWLATDGQTSAPDEIEAVQKLEAFREATGLLKDLSFDTIAGAGPNGAIVHYRPTYATNRRARAGDLLLVDSGAQYVDGTTDVTRTVAIGEPSAEARARFTLVLRGHISLARARFPAGTPGAALDALARRPLWEAGLDYDHGTGHGVGSYLGVHEGPQRIDKGGNLTPQLNPATRLLPGMIVSNEPGYYKSGAYGIRIENLQVVTPPVAVAGGERPMLSFEVLTLAPIDRRLIDREALDQTERGWLDDYHARVLREIGPLVEPDVQAWLEHACAPI